MENCNQIGLITETNLLLKALENNISVSIPYGDKQKYDVIWDINKKLYRIQIKTSRLKKVSSGKAFMFNCYSVVNGTKHKYTKEDIDFFATFWENKIYLIPVEECSTEKTLWLEKGNNFNTTCSEASKYELTEVLKNI